MEKLIKRSDNIFETSSGTQAIAMLRKSGFDEETNKTHFDYAPKMTSPNTVRVEWETSAPHDMLVIDPDYARSIVSKGFARDPNQAMVDAYQEWADENPDMLHGLNEPVEAETAKKPAKPETAKKPAKPVTPPAEPETATQPVTPPAEPETATQPVTPPAEPETATPPVTPPAEPETATPPAEPVIGLELIKSEDVGSMSREELVQVATQLKLEIPKNIGIKNLRKRVISGLNA